MSKEFYNYLAQRTVDFFQSTLIQEGEKYILNFNDENEVHSFYEALDNLLQIKADIKREYSIIDDDKYDTLGLTTKGNVCVFVVPELNITQAYMTRLRNTIKANWAMLIVACNSIDSISRGTESLSKEGLPFCRTQLVSDIKEKIESSSLDTVAESLFTSFELPSVLVNLGSCYDLLPNKDYTDDWQWIYSYKRTYDHWYDYFIDNGNFTYFTFDEFDELISDDYNNYLWIDGKYNHSRIKISQNNTNNLKRIALVGSNRNTISTIQHCPGDRGLQFVPEYGIGDSVVPIESATMNFNHDLLDIKIFDQDHMGLIQSQECIDEILKNIKDTKSFMKLPMRTKMANNNLTSNAIEETKTLSNKLAISGYFDLFFSNETCSYYYTNSEVHEGNNFKFDPLTSVGNPILLAQFADDNYDCKINSLADQNTDIMCNIDGNIYLYTNISVNSGSVLFLNLSDGSFFINIDLDNDGEIDTTVTPTINPGVIQDDEKSPEITVESCNAGISNSNTINPNIVITNNSDKPLKMSDITINYVFNADNKENLEYHCDWLAVDNQYLGNTSVCEFVNDDYGNTYAKIKFNTDVELQPNKQFVIHFRLNAADWSNWDTSNDYSMGTEQLLPNDKIIVFYNEQLISGVQP